MHNNYYFLRQLSANLANFLPGFVFAECYSQSKNELILLFQKDDREFVIKAHLQPDFSCLYISEEASRAKRNSVDLFKEAINLKVEEVLQYRNERSFLLKLENEYGLLFKMHGNRANVLLTKGNEPVALFNNKLVKDWNITITELHRDLDTSREAFLAAEGNYKKLYPTLGKLPEAYFREKGYDEMDREEQWNLLSSTVRQLENPEQYYIVELQGQPALSLLLLGREQARFNSPAEALSRFFIAYTREYTLHLEKQAALQQLLKEIRSSENYLQKTGSKLSELQNSLKNREMADIIMANLHSIPPGSTEATLYNFYNDQEVTIKLKKDLSPQKNAENFYRKAKNQQLEEKYLQENINRKEEKLLELQLHYEEIEKKDNLKELRSYLKQTSLTDTLKTDSPPLPYREYEFEGFQIWVGKGSSQNDTMLRFHAHKDDLWLHAKDVSGSHVLLKRKPGKNFPVAVKEKAASLAAWYSKRKNDTLCPVICTPRKWVRKLKGAAAGMVMVDKEEEVLLVNPARF